MRWNKQKLADVTATVVSTFLDGNLDDGIAMDENIFEIIRELFAMFNTFEYRYRNEVHNVIEKLATDGIVSKDSIMVYVNERSAFNLTPIDAKIIKAILSGTSSPEKDLKKLFIEYYMSQEERLDNLIKNLYGKLD